MQPTIPEAAQRRVAHVMTTEVITVELETPVSDIAQLMAAHNISGLPVVNDQGRVVGVVTELDMIVRNTRFKMPNYIMILDMMIYLETPQHYEERLRQVLGVTAKEIMSKPAVTIKPEATIEELTELMVNQRKNPIPVVENGQLVGIVSRQDIIQLMAQDFAAEE